MIWSRTLFFPFFLQTRGKNIHFPDRDIIYIIMTTLVVSHVGQKLSQFFTEGPTLLDLFNVMLFICSSICSWTKRQREKQALGLVRKTDYVASLALPLCFVYMVDLWWCDLYDNQERQAEVTPDGVRRHIVNMILPYISPPFISFLCFSLSLVRSFCMSACITDPSPL